MSTDVAWAKRSHEESWRPILGLAIEEVFEIMLGCPVEPVSAEDVVVKGDFTAMVGLAGALCGVLTVCCEAATARKIANAMLGDAADSEGQVADALGEICNMITGNFESGSAQMKAASQAAFDRIASMLRQRDYHLRIEGHTDNTPIHSAQFPSNWELSTARATEVVRLLIVRDGFAPDRLSAAGYSEYHPVASNRNLEGRGMNRRVDIVILGHAPPLSQVTQVTTQMPGNSAEAPNRATDDNARVNPMKPSPEISKPVVVNTTIRGLKH